MSLPREPAQVLSDALSLADPTESPVAICQEEVLLHYLAFNPEPSPEQVQQLALVLDITQEQLETLAIQVDDDLNDDSEDEDGDGVPDDLQALDDLYDDEALDDLDPVDAVLLSVFLLNPVPRPEQITALQSLCDLTPDEFALRLINLLNNVLNSDTEDDEAQDEPANEPLSN